MKLANFGRYDFRFRDDVLIVRNEKGVMLKPQSDNYHYKRKYRLVDDNGNATSVQELRIAYCILNHCSFEQIKGKKITGSVKQPRLMTERISLPPDKALSKIQEIEFCLEKLKHYYLTGDISFFFQYANDCHTRFQAIATTAALISASTERLEAVYDNAVDAFVDEIKQCSFTCIKPLFGMLCKHLKVVYYRNAKEIRTTLNAPHLCQ